jgi:hypothetical protein
MTSIRIAVATGMAAMAVLAGAASVHHTASGHAGVLAGVVKSESPVLCCDDDD